MKENSRIPQALSLNALDDHRAYDVRIGYGRKKVQSLRKLPTQKARVVTFYRNGDGYFSGAKLSFLPGRDFKNINSVYDILSQKIKIPQGVRHIFTLDGKKIKDLEQLQDGKAYVASGVKTFQEMSYGQIAPLPTAHLNKKPNVAPLRSDDLKLLRPLSPGWKVSKKKTLNKNAVLNFRGSGATSLPGSQESRIITLINRYDESLKCRVLLNLRTSQAFEDVLEDMGQSIKIRKGARMLTPWGEEVRSFSHLKNDFYEVETFFLDSEDSEPPAEVHSKRNLNAKSKNSRTNRSLRSNSAPGIKDLLWFRRAFGSASSGQMKRKYLNHWDIISVLTVTDFDGIRRLDDAGYSNTTNDTKQPPMLRVRIPGDYRRNRESNRRQIFDYHSDA